MKNTKGFTYIELIVVILCLGALAGIAIVKNPFGISDYSGIASHQLVADIRVVQLKSMGTKRPQKIVFNIGASTYDLMENTTVLEQKKLPKDVLIRTARFGSNGNVLNFNTLGEPSSGGTVTLGDSSGAYVTVTVDAITGRVVIS